MRLSRRALIEKPEGYVEPVRRPRPEGERRGFDRGGDRRGGFGRGGERNDRGPRGERGDRGGFRAPRGENHFNENNDNGAETHNE